MAATKGNRFAAVAANRAAPTPTPASADAVRKYTVLLTERVAVDFDDDIARLRRQLGRRVDKSAVIRTLLTLLHEDDELYGRVADGLPS